ncbi:MAG: hypothetical protein JWP97_4711 [Labilithrix sp.]|nr:hypothetical protein [Labilithrix sp.]
MRAVPRWVRVLVLAPLLLALRASPACAAPLAIDEPRSGIHLEVEGACLVKPAPRGEAGAACASFAASAHQSERFAVVLGPDGLLSYSVAVFAEREAGRGEERARRVATALGSAVVGEPEAVTAGGTRFVRAELQTVGGAALAYVSVDGRPEVALVLFASEPGRRALMLAGAEQAMGTVRWAGADPAPPVPGPRHLSRAALAGALLLVAVVAVVAVALRRRRAS